MSTTVGAEGLDITAGETLLLADDAESFAAAIITLLSNRTVWRSLVAAARRFVEERHDWDLIARKQLDIYDEILEQT